MQKPVNEQGRIDAAHPLGEGMGSAQGPEMMQLKTAKKAAHADVLLVVDEWHSVEDFPLLDCLLEAGIPVVWTTFEGLLESDLSNTPDVIFLDLQETSAKRELEAARSILSNSPEKSILITRGVGESSREEEASVPQLYWLQLPLDLARLPAQIGCEVKKAAVRRAILSTPGFPPRQVLRVLCVYDESLSGDASRDILQEIQAESRHPDMTKDPIDSLYVELAELSARVSKEPDVEPLMQQKMEHLRQLQTKEAAAMTTWFEAQRSLQPGSGYEAIKRAEELIAHEG